MSTIQVLIEQSTQAIQVTIKTKILQLSLGHAAWSAVWHKGIKMIQAELVSLNI